MTRLLVVCADGATPATARSGGFFAAPRDKAPLQALRSIYPASTAPAHASMLTGRLPKDHGVVANRYWQDEPVEVIRASQDPIAALHPYEHDALRVPSVLTALHARGLSTAAVMFPQTFSLREGGPGAIASAFCCYIPTAHHTVPPAGTELQVAGLGFDLRLSATVTATGVSLTGPGGGHAWTATIKRPADIQWTTGRWALSFRVLVDEITDRSAQLRRGTAVGVLAAGQIAVDTLVGGAPTAHSLTPAYTAGGETNYFQAPSARWVTRAALTLLDDQPDVLLVRYNQIDHAQEHLYWHAVNGEPNARRSAREQILDTYRDVEREIAALRAAVGSQVPTLLFSDHGITDVSRQVDPNALLNELGLATEFVFQGDSHLAFLYGDRPLTPAEHDRLTSALPGVQASTTADLQRRGVHASGRCGQLALRTPSDTAFAYSGEVADAPVQRATHGFNPALAEMHGLVRLLGAWPPTTTPTSLLSLAPIIDAITR